MSQKEVFLESEGDAWYARNPAPPTPRAQALARTLKEMHIAPSAILEVGCAGGGFLAALQQEFSAARCAGIDPSARAIEDAGARYPDMTFRQSTADDLPFKDASFDLVILGFCLYLTDPADHFRAAWQTDRVTRSPGFVVVRDFLPPSPYRNSYAHKPGLFSHKMNFSGMLTWHPAYALLSRTYREHSSPYGYDADERVITDILRKDADMAFPRRR
ncbi:MAG TPA: class I SAM-dependent methyltransferase [Rhizomicrobium sp.]|nr:class I SAM-dependent methyltransferase [Rhizomicrobium sp.]